MLSFDPQYSVYDTTPLENLFILEYLPKAPGDYVRVYLYGLMHVYHPAPEMSLAHMAKALDIPESEVLAAYRYWIRRGLVVRTAEHPPAFRYIGAKLSLLSGSIAPPDDAYEVFYKEVCALFGDARTPHGSEIKLAYEWVEELHLPAEAVLALIAFCIKSKGAHFSFKAAQKDAMRLAEEHVQSAEDAQAVLARSKRALDGVRKVLRRLNKRRLPSEDEITLYETWLTDYGFTEEAILEACRETVKGEPTLAYLDGILRGIARRAAGKAPTTRAEMEKQLAADSQRGEPLKEMFRALGMRSAPITEGTLAVYSQLLALAPHETILLAASECAKHGKNGLDDLTQMVTAWHKRGLREPEEAREHVAAFNRQTAFLKELFTLWGQQRNPSAHDRTTLARWETEWSFSPEAINAAAVYAGHTQRPVAYLDAVLASLHAKGAHTPEAVQKEMTDFRKDRKAQGAGNETKKLSQQAYTQREYDEDDLSELKRYFGGEDA